MIIDVEWGHRIHASSRAERGSGARSVFAWLLRHIADRLDNGQSIRVEYSTRPAVDPRLAADCIERGLSHANRLLSDMAQHQACEELLREHFGELFEEARG